jgi:hypothetical protein
MKCPKCGTSNPDASSGCQACGYAFVAKTTARASSGDSARDVKSTDDSAGDEFERKADEPATTTNAIPGRGSVAEEDSDGISEDQSSNVELERIFVGANYDYYFKKWHTGDQKSSKQSWNWAAFFLGFLWAAYRKMYMYSCLFAVVPSIALLGKVYPIANVIALAIYVLFGWQGNSWYKRHVETKVKEMTAINTPEKAKLELARRGGTSVGTAFGLLIVSMMVLGIVAGVAGLRF